MDSLLGVLAFVVVFLVINWLVSYPGAPSSLIARQHKFSRQTQPVSSRTRPVFLVHQRPNAFHPRVVFFDIETQRSADEVGGWRKIYKMGIALAVVWDSVDGRFSVYQERHLIPFLQHLLYADLVVGFNSIRFDYQVMRGYIRCNPASVLPSFDLLQALTARVKLDVLARETLGISKTADGLQSLQWYRAGRLDLIEEYCRQDVAILRDLFAHAMKRHCLYSRSKDGKRLTHPTPWSHGVIVEEAWKKVPERGSISVNNLLRAPRKVR